MFYLPHKKWFQWPISLDSAEPVPKAVLCLVTRLPQQWWPTHSTQHSLIPGSQCTAGGLAARIAVPLRESPEWHETHRSFVLQRKFSTYPPFLEPVHCPTHRERQKLGRQLRQWESRSGFTPLTPGPAALQCQFPQKTVLNYHTQIFHINKQANNRPGFHWSLISITMLSLKTDFADFTM